MVQAPLELPAPDVFRPAPFRARVRPDERFVVASRSMEGAKA